MTTQNLKLRAPVPFPANVSGTGGISVEKTNGEWVIAPDFADLATVVASAVGDPTSKQIWIYDPVSGEYNVLTLAGLGNALYKTTSTTSLAIATGSKTWTVQSGKDFIVGDYILATSDSGPTNFMLGNITAYSGTTLTVSVTTTGGSGTKTDWTLRASAPAGSTGKSSGWSYLWDTSTTAADPGAGKVRANNATLSSATVLYISETDNDANALATAIATWDDGTSTIRGRLKIYNPVTPVNFVVLDVTGSNTDSGAYDAINVSYVIHGGSFAAADALRIEYVAKGDKGDTGVTGTDGTSSGIKYNFETSTTMAIPASGGLRLNHATIGSATGAAINALSGESGNPSVLAWLQAFDDSSTTGHRGYIILRKFTAQQNFAIFDITGALTDNTTWVQLALTYVTGSGTFSAADVLTLSFIRTGDKGAAGAGSGDVLAANNLSDMAAKYTAYDNISIHGADVASATTTNLETATGNLVDVTGTTTITAITLSEGHERTVRFTGILTLTHGASLVLPGAASITTAAGDYAIFRGYAAGVVRCATYVRASGKPVFGVVTLTDLSQAFTGGLTTAEFDNGTKTTGSYTPEPGNGPFQKVTDNGAHTLVASSNMGSFKLRVTNGASAGAITFSGFDKALAGDTYATTNTNQYDIYITIAGRKTYAIKALQ